MMGYEDTMPGDKNFKDDPVGVGIHPADIEYDHKDKSEGETAMNRHYVEAQNEQRRAFAIEQAQSHSASIEELLENAQKIVTYLESNGG